MFINKLLLPSLVADNKEWLLQTSGYKEEASVPKIGGATMRFAEVFFRISTSEITDKLRCSY